jgi:hypothetical protein
MATVLLVVPGHGAAQEAESAYQISQRALVSQDLANAVVSLEYSRPLARGRTDLFGKVVHWGELWTPGANDATVLEVSEEVRLNGHAVPPGRWSMWIIPSRVGPWELVLDARDTLFHTQRPELDDEQIRFVVDVTHDADHVEVLTWSFPRVADDGGTMQMNWGTTEVGIAVEVQSNMPVVVVAADAAAPYLGEWDVLFERNPMTGETMPPTVLTIRHAEDGSLAGNYPPLAFAPPAPEAPEPPAADMELTPQEQERADAQRALMEQQVGEFDFVLVPRAHGVFMLGFVQDGALLEVADVYHEFEFEGDNAVRMVIRGPDDVVFARGTRRVPQAGGSSDRSGEQ